MDGPRYSEAFRRMEAMIRRGAPKLLRAGGGSVEREVRNRKKPESIKPPTKITTEVQRRMVVLYYQHDKNITQVARDMDLAPKTVWHNLIKLGVHKKERE